MKATITSVEFKKEYPSKYGGVLYGFQVGYNGKFGFYSSKKKDQTKFVKGQEAEFEEVPMNSNGKDWTKIKPIYQNQPKNSNFSRAVKKEQSRYTTMGASYVKDLIIAGAVDLDDWQVLTESIVKFMHQLDSELEK